MIYVEVSLGEKFPFKSAQELLHSETNHTVKLTNSSFWCYKRNGCQLCATSDVVLGDKFKLTNITPRDTNKKCSVTWKQTVRAVR